MYRDSDQEEDICSALGEDLYFAASKLPAWYSASYW